jgi:hypothetical protein
MPYRVGHNGEVYRVMKNSGIKSRKKTYRTRAAAERARTKRFGKRRGNVTHGVTRLRY